MSETVEKRISIVVTQSGIDQISSDLRNLAGASTAVGNKLSPIAMDLDLITRASRSKTEFSRLSREITDFMRSIGGMSFGVGQFKTIASSLTEFVTSLNAVPKLQLSNLSSLLSGLNMLSGIKASSFSGLSGVATHLVNFVGATQSLSGGLFRRGVNITPLINSLSQLASVAQLLSPMLGVLRQLSTILPSLGQALGGMPPTGFKIVVDQATMTSLSNLNNLLTSIHTKLRTMPRTLNITSVSSSVAGQSVLPQAPTAGYVKRWTDTTGAIHGSNRALHFFRTALTTIGFSAFIRLISEAIDEFTELSTRVMLTAHNLDNYTESLSALWRIAGEVRSEISSLSKLFNKFHISLEPFGATIEQTSAFVKALAQTIKISGSNTAETKAFYVQFGQAIQSGLLRGREFRSMLESNLYMSRLLASELAGGDLGRLKELAFRGELDTLTVTNAVLKNQDKINKSFESVALTISDMFTLIKNELINTFMQWEKVIGTSKIFQGSLGWIKDNIQGIIVAVTAFVSTTMVQLLAQFGLLGTLAKGTVLGLLVLGLYKMYKNSELFRKSIDNSIQYVKDVWEGLKAQDTILGDMVEKVKEFVNAFENFDADLAFLSLERQLVKVASIIDIIMHPMGGGQAGLTVGDALFAMYAPSDKRLNKAVEEIDTYRTTLNALENALEDAGEKSKKRAYEESKYWTGLSDSVLNSGVAVDMMYNSAVDTYYETAKAYEELSKQILDYQENIRTKAPRVKLFNETFMAEDLNKLKTMTNEANARVTELQDINSKAKQNTIDDENVRAYIQILKHQAGVVQKLFVASDIKSEEGSQVLNQFIEQYKRAMRTLIYYTDDSPEKIQQLTDDMVNEIANTFSYAGKDVLEHSNKLYAMFDKVDKDYDAKIEESLKNRKSAVIESVQETTAGLIEGEKLLSGLYTKFLGATAIETDITWTPNLVFKPNKNMVQNWLELKSFSDNLFYENVGGEDTDLDYRDRLADYFTMLNNLWEAEADAIKFKSKELIPEDVSNKIASLTQQTERYLQNITEGYVGTGLGKSLDEYYTWLRSLVALPTDTATNRMTAVQGLMASVIKTAQDANVSIDSVIQGIEDGLLRSENLLTTMADLVATGAKFEIKQDFFGKYSDIQDLVQDSEMLMQIYMRYPTLLSNANKDAKQYEETLLSIANILKYSEFQYRTPESMFGKGLLQGFKDLKMEYAEIIDDIAGLTKSIFEDIAMEANKFFLQISNDWRELAQSILKQISDYTFKAMVFGESGILSNLGIKAFQATPTIKDTQEQPELSAMQEVMSGLSGVSGASATVTGSLSVASGALGTFSGAILSATVALQGLGTGSALSAGADALGSSIRAGAGAVVPDVINYSQFGNDIEAGEPTWVGERGRELWIPDQDGRVVNNTASEAQTTTAEAPTIVFFDDRNAMEAYMNSPKGKKAIFKNMSEFLIKA